MTAQHGSNPKATSGRMDKHSMVLLCNRILPQTRADMCITRTESRGLMLNERSRTQEHTLHDPILRSSWTGNTDLCCGVLESSYPWLGDWADIDWDGTWGTFWEEMFCTWALWTVKLGWVGRLSSGPLFNPHSCHQCYIRKLSLCPLKGANIKKEEERTQPPLQKWEELDWNHFQPAL